MIDKEKVNRRIKLIVEADAVEVMGEAENVKVEWDSEATGTADNQLLLLTWEDDSCLEFSVIFTEQGLNDAIDMGQGILSLVDHEGEPVQLRLWERSPMCVKW